jgi:hypothetical protein
LGGTGEFLYACILLRTRHLPHRDPTLIVMKEAPTNNRLLFHFTASDCQARDEARRIAANIGKLPAAGRRTTVRPVSLADMAFPADPSAQPFIISATAIRGAHSAFGSPAAPPRRLCRPVSTSSRPGRGRPQRKIKKIWCGCLRAFECESVSRFGGIPPGRLCSFRKGSFKCTQSTFNVMP